MGYEIAGGIGMKMAQPNREAVVMVGDGTYLMMNSELATSIMLGIKLTVILLDNRGYGCINRLQFASGGERFNNLFDYNTKHEVSPDIDFVAHAKSLGAVAEKASSLADLERALKNAKNNDRSTVIVIDTDPMATTDAGGTWWDVAIPEVSTRKQVRAARKGYVKALAKERSGN
jgi:3D-(3,5/4)-trihydroxycyclohexane-1,2-dione acylhydrolase (decyclizing)